MCVNPRRCASHGLGLLRPTGLTYTRVMTGGDKGSLTEQKGKNMSGFFRKAQAESEIDAIVRNVCDAFRDEFGVEPSISNDGAPFSFRAYHFDPRGKCVVIARRVIDYWVLDVVIQVSRKDEILKGQASTTDTSYDGVKAAISDAIYHGIVVDRISGEVIRHLACRRSA